MNYGQKLCQIYDNWILKRKAENDAKRVNYDPTWFHASNVSLVKCPLELYWGIKLSIPSVFPLNVLKIFEMGNSVHERIQVAFKEMGILLPENEERKFYLPDYNICGRTDGVVNLDEDVVIEIKSISSNGFKLLNKAKKEHVIQNLIYQKGFGLQNGVVIYENKDNQEWKTFDISYDESLIQEKLDNCKLAKNLLEGGKLPEDFKCRILNCQFKVYCDKNFFNVKNIEITEKSDTIDLSVLGEDFKQIDECIF